MDVETKQLWESTTAQLQDRLAALWERYNPKNDGGGYPMAQLRELHLIEEELRQRARSEREPYHLSDDERHPEPFCPDNHTALDRATDVERYR
jgi:hypothetical protein